MARRPSWTVLPPNRRKRPTPPAAGTDQGAAGGGVPGGEPAGGGGRAARAGRFHPPLLADAADTAVYGAFVSLKRGGRLRSCCGHIEPSVPLCEALDAAADRAATDDPRFPPITPAELDQLDMDVWILWGPQPVAARGEDRVAGGGDRQARRADRPRRRPRPAAAGRGRRPRLRRPDVSANRFASRPACRPTPGKTTTPSCGCSRAMRFTAGWRSEVGRDARPPAVAGGFYPGEPREVQRGLDKLFAAGLAGRRRSRGRAPWCRTPAGSIPAVWPRPCSSRVEIPEQAIVLARNIARTAPAGRWRRTAAGCSPAASWPPIPELAARLAEGVGGLELDAAAHRQEHAIEVQLPLLARLAPQVRVVGIAVGDASLPELLQFGVAMSVVLRDMPQRPLLVISSDMNHFADDAETRRLDRLALDAIATLDPEHVYETVRRNRISMCGMAPCVVAMEALRWLGCLNRCESVGYATSAEAGGATDRVVGYAGVLFG